MSYDIYIGEAVLDVPEESDRGDWNAIDVKVKRFEHPEAPCFPGDEMTGKSNSRHPAYLAWDDFCKKVGLYDLFFGARDTSRSPFPEHRHAPTRDVSLMTEHPGTVILTKQDLAEVQEALANWKAKPWPTAERIAGWDEEARTKVEADPRYDGNLARLVWLEWWMTWALANCKVPALHNR